MAQTLQLGVLSSEVTLPTESRAFVSSGNDLSSMSGRSADGTLHEDFIANKKSFTISYSVISEANKDIITGIYNSQISGGTFLNFIYTNQAGGNVSTTVRMAAPSFGSIIPNAVYYYNGCTIELEEV